MKTRVIVCRRGVRAAVRLRAHAAIAPSRHRLRRRRRPRADQQFEALAQRYLRESTEQSPVGATGLGDHRFDDRLDDVSAAGWQAQLAFADVYLSTLESIDRAKLSRANQVDALLLRHDLEFDRWKLQTLQDWRWNPLLYTRIAGDGALQPAGARIRAAPGTHAQRRQTSRRDAALPRAGARGAGARASPEGLRGDRGPAERRAR